jgi:hypothetical protein
MCTAVIGCNIQQHKQGTASPDKTPAKKLNAVEMLADFKTKTNQRIRSIPFVRQN